MTKCITKTHKQLAEMNNRINKLEFLSKTLRKLLNTSEKNRSIYDKQYIYFLTNKIHKIEYHIGLHPSNDKRFFKIQG